MGLEIEIVEERLKSFLGQLQAEYGILDRVVYKNKNQHRRCSYFQYLLKVRRDLRLLQSAKLEEILNSSFQLISGNKPKQKVQLLESLKRRRGDGGKYNFLERLLGIARLLSQMAEPMLKAATEISTLLARSFFMGFSMTVLALLARLRVLVQQILLDVVSVFNMVSSLSQKEQAVKITQEGFEVFREYHPTKEQAVSLECVWETDKFVLIERINKSENKSQENDIGEDISVGASKIQYQSIEVMLGDDGYGKTNSSYASEQCPANIKQDNTSSLVGPIIESNTGNQLEDRSGFAGFSREIIPLESHGLLTSSSSSSYSNPLGVRSCSRNKVAFVSVKRPTPSTAKEFEFDMKEIGSNDGGKDPFFSLLTCGNLKNSLV